MGQPLFVIRDSGDRVSLARFRRNKFRLHPSHDFVAGPSNMAEVAMPSKLTLPPLQSTHNITFCYHLSDVMSNSYCSELSIYKSLSSIAEPLEVIVVLD